jgi:hypothetical protein
MLTEEEDPIKEKRVHCPLVAKFKMHGHKK